MNELSPEIRQIINDNVSAINVLALLVSEDLANFIKEDYLMMLSRHCLELKKIIK